MLAKPLITTEYNGSGSRVEVSVLACPKLNAIGVSL
jgi:hypothetical protein